MQHDDIPLPTNKLRRRSLFDDEKVENKTVQIDIPEPKCEIYYPLEYVEKVRTEIEEWKMHVTKTLEERKKIRNEMALQNTVLDESVLSKQQQDFFISLGFDEYMRKVETFGSRTEILAHKIQYKPENDIERKCIAIQNKIEKTICKKNCK